MSFLPVMELLVIGLYVLHLVFFLGMGCVFLARVSLVPLPAQRPEVPHEENPLVNTTFERLQKLQLTQINIMRMINRHADAMDHLDERLQHAEKKIADVTLRSERDHTMIYENLMLLNGDVHALRKEAVLPETTRLSLLFKGIQEIPQESALKPRSFSF